MGGTLKDIVRQGAAPPEAFGFSRGSGSPRVSPRSNAIGGTGRNSTPELDGPLEKTPKNKQA